MKRAIVACLLTALLSGCGSFNFRPFGLVVCTSACTFDLAPPPVAAAASAPP